MVKSEQIYIEHTNKRSITKKKLKTSGRQILYTDFYCSKEKRKCDKEKLRESEKKY